LGLMGNERVKTSSSGALSSEQIVRAGVRGQSDINAIATRRDQAREAEILIWNYNDDDVPVRDATIDLVVSGLPVNAKRALLEHFRIDSTHSNAFAVWKEMGSPAAPSAEEYRRLDNAGQLQPLDSPRWTTIQEGAIRLQVILPRQGLSLLRLAW